MNPPRYADRHPQLNLTDHLDARPALSDAEQGRALVSRVRGGDVAAFEDLYHLYWTALYNFAFRYVQSAEEAEDVVQEVFLRVWRNHAEWNVIGPVQGYLYLAVRNQALDRLKRHATARRWREAVRAADVVETPSDTGDETLRDAALNAAVERAIAEMPTKRRAVCALRWGDGLSYAQIADRLGITEKAVEIHIGRGLKFLRERLAALRP